MKKFLLDCQKTETLNRKKGALASLHRRHPELDALSILGDNTTIMSTTSYLYYFLKRHAAPCSLRGKISAGTYSYQELQKMSDSLVEHTYLADRKVWRNVEAIVYLESQQILNPVSDKEMVQILRTADRHAFVRGCPTGGFPKGVTHPQCLFNFLLSRMDTRVSKAVKAVATTPQKATTLSLLMEELLD